MDVEFIVWLKTWCIEMIRMLFQKEFHRIVWIVCKLVHPIPVYTPFWFYKVCFIFVFKMQIFLYFHVLKLVYLILQNILNNNTDENNIVHQKVLILYSKREKSLSCYWGSGKSNFAKASFCWPPIDKSSSYILHWVKILS